MNLKAGDRVLIDLEMAQAHYTMGVSQCCGRPYDQDDLHRLLHYMAEGEWRVAKQQIGLVICAKAPRRNHSGGIIPHS